MKVEHRDWDLFLKIAEYPFIKTDMTPEEFDEELMYLGDKTLRKWKYKSIISLYLYFCFSGLKITSSNCL